MHMCSLCRKVTSGEKKREEEMHFYPRESFLCNAIQKKPARNLAAYRVFSLVGAHAPGTGNTDCTLGKQEAKQILLIFIRNTQS